MIVNGDAKVKGKLIYGLKNNKKFGYFSCDGQKSWNLLFDWLLLSKVYKDLDEKAQKSYLITLKSDSWFQKWHEEFSKF